MANKWSNIKTKSFLIVFGVFFNHFLQGCSSAWGGAKEHVRLKAQSDILTDSSIQTHQMKAMLKYFILWKSASSEWQCELCDRPAVVLVSFTIFIPGMTQPEIEASQEMHQSTTLWSRSSRKEDNPTSTSWTLAVFCLQLLWLPSRAESNPLSSLKKELPDEFVPVLPFREGWDSYCSVVRYHEPRLINVLDGEMLLLGTVSHVSE